MSTYYFSHDENAREDERIVDLMISEGVAGYGIYWVIVEELYKAGGTLQESDIRRIAYNLHLETCHVERVVKNYNLFSFGDGQFWSESALRRIEKRNGISDARRKAVEARWNKKTYTNVSEHTNVSEIHTNVSEIHTNVKKTNTNVFFCMENEQNENNSEAQNSTRCNPEIAKNGSSDTNVSENHSNVLQMNALNDKYINNNNIKATNVAMSTAVDAEAKKPTIDFDGIIKAWNGLVADKSMPQIKSITGTRRNSVRARINEFGKQEFWRALQLAAKSAFLNGHNSRSFIASFDWIIKPNNFPKVLEGNYNTDQQIEAAHAQEQQQEPRAIDPRHKVYQSQDTGGQISQAQFFKLKAAADAGDEEARRILNDPNATDAVIQQWLRKH